MSGFGASIAEGRTAPLPAPPPAQFRRAATSPNFMRRAVVGDLADRFGREAVEGVERVRILAAHGRAALGALACETGAREE